MKIRSIKIAGIALFSFCLYCFASSVIADTARTYDVQVLIFSHITPDTLQLQQWPLITAQPPAATNTTAPQPATQLQLEKNVLAHNPNYKILFDGSWLESWTTGSTITIPVMSSNQKLNGTIAITLGHYFNVQANLFLTEPTHYLQSLDPENYFSKFDQLNFTFQLLQNRRMRSDELNYLEHPLIGMLIKIIPAANKQNEKNEKTT